MSNRNSASLSLSFSWCLRFNQGRSNWEDSQWTKQCTRPKRSKLTAWCSKSRPLSRHRMPLYRHGVGNGNLTSSSWLGAMQDLSDSLSVEWIILRDPKSISGVSACQRVEKLWEVRSRLVNWIERPWWSWCESAPLPQSRELPASDDCPNVQSRRNPSLPTQKHLNPWSINQLSDLIISNMNVIPVGPALHWIRCWMMIRSFLVSHWFYFAPNICKRHLSSLQWVGSEAIVLFGSSQVPLACIG